MDITDVSLWRDQSALDILFALAGAPDPSTPQGYYALTWAGGPCPVRFFVATGTGDAYAIPADDAAN